MADTGMTIVVRLIRSFEHRTIKPVVFKNVSPDITTEQLCELIHKGIVFVLQL